MTKHNLAQFVAFALISSGLSLSAASAQEARTPFDGLWVLDVPPSPVIAHTSESMCPALRLPVSIQDGHIVGSLMRVPAPDAGLVVEEGTGPNAAPITGGVAPNGTLQAQWQGFQAYGQLNGSTGKITLQTECGPMIATATRLDVPGAASTAKAKAPDATR
jgi:hypothetical protein